MRHLPIFADLAGRDCLVVGGGVVAARRVEQLLGVGARVTVIAPGQVEAIAALAAAGRIELEAADYSGQSLEAYWLVVAATDDEYVNARVARDAEAAHRFCNVVDAPRLSTYISPALIDRDPVTIAVSSGGHSPVVARWVKGLVEAAVPLRVGALARLAGEWRRRVKEALPDADDRRRFWQSIVRGKVAEHALAGRERDSGDALLAALERWRSRTDRGRHFGEAYLVGAGPGGIDLMTLRGRQLLAEADVVLYDRLVNREILEYARRDADFISVAKTPGKPSISQEEINELLVGFVKAGKKVCRLKGGNPMLFSRIGEELEALAGAGLAFQIVPGVSALEGCAAYAGIPLTLRGVSQTLVVSTGHSADCIERDLKHVRPGQTLALYMGVANFAPISAGLIENGLDAATPVAIVESGTTDRQRVVRTTLKRLAEAAKRHAIAPPALLIAGDVVKSAQAFAWFAPHRLEVHDPDAVESLARAG